MELQVEENGAKDRKHRWGLRHFLSLEDRMAVLVQKQVSGESIKRQKQSARWFSF